MIVFDRPVTSAGNSVIGGWSKIELLKFIDSHEFKKLRANFIWGAVAEWSKAMLVRKKKEAGFAPIF